MTGDRSPQTWALLTAVEEVDLASRGFNARWVAREVGYHQLAVKLSADQVARRIAAAVEDLHSRVGDVHAPNVPRSRRLPRLAELTTEKPAPGGRAHTPPPQEVHP